MRIFRITLEDILPAVTAQALANKITWNNAQLVNIKQRITQRLFEKGLNSEDKQMLQARIYPPPNTRKSPRGLEYRKYKYRYHTGQLLDSLIVSTFRKNGLKITWRRRDVILDSLIARYGQMFDFSPSDIEYIKYLILVKIGLKNPSDTAPTISSKGAARYRRRI